jgi:imidazole glycerol-phosphate synthase subunit HisF
MANVLKVGIEKIVVNHQCFADINVITEACKAYGSSTVVASMDVKKDFWGKQKVFTLNGTLSTKTDPLTYAKQMEQAGVGELFVNSIDRDGTYTGYDIDLIKQISEAVQIPVIACGGAGSLADVRKVLDQGKASAAAAGSIFCFYGPHRAVLINYPTAEQF